MPKRKMNPKVQIFNVQELLSSEHNCLALKHQGWYPTINDYCCHSVIMADLS